MPISSSDGMTDVARNFVDLAQMLKSPSLVFTQMALGAAMPDDLSCTFRIYRYVGLTYLAIKFVLVMHGVKWAGYKHFCPLYSLEVGGLHHLARSWLQFAPFLRGSNFGMLMLGLWTHLTERLIVALAVPRTRDGDIS